MAKQNPTPPAVGTRPSVRITPDLADDLALIMRTGGTYADAVRDACAYYAAELYAAWAAGTLPPDTAPPAPDRG